MALRKNKVSTPAQGGGDALPTQKEVTPQTGVASAPIMDVVITQELLDENPKLVAEGLKVGEVVQVPVESDVEKLQTTETTDQPQATEQPNDVVSGGDLDSKETAYLVLKEFRDINDFNKVYSEGSLVYSLEQHRIDHLVNIGYLKPAK